MLTRHALIAAASVLSAVAVAPAAAAVPTYASAVPAGGYVRGTVIFSPDPNVYANPSAATGPVEPIVGAGGAWASLYSPFNAHYETDQLVAVGRGGSLTLQFADPVPLTGGHQLGVFTNAGLVDASYPDGSAGPVATTFARAEYGAERSAVVEIGTSPSDMISLGRVVFANPGNYYANTTDNGLSAAPYPAVPADFGAPFTQPLSAFDGKDFAGVIATLGSSAGGTWIDVPADLALASFSYVRFSDPLWVLPDGSTAETRPSAYDSTYIKPADLILDAVVAIPEPASLALLALGTLALRGCRR